MIHLGIAGVNKEAEKHIKALSELDNVRISGIFDEDHSQAVKFAIDHQINLFDSAHELFRKSDVIDLTHFTNSSYYLTIQVIKESKHIYLANPLKFNLSKIKYLIKLANEADINFHIQSIDKYNPVLLLAKQFIRDPKIIEIYREFSQKEKREVLEVNKYLLHDLEIIFGSVQSTIKKVSPTGVYFNKSNSEVINARIEFNNGAIATIVSNNISETPSLKAVFYQNNAIITADFNNGFIQIKRPQLSRIRTEKEYVIQANPIKKEFHSFINSIYHRNYSALSNEDECITIAVANEIIDKINLRSLHV